MPQFILVPGAIAGLVLGIAFIALTALTGTLSYGAREMAGLAAIAVVSMGGQFVGVTLATRARLTGERVAFAPRYFVAMLTGAVTALVYGLFTWINFTFVDTDYLDAFYASYLERASRESASPEETRQILAAAEQMKNFIIDPFSQAMIQFGTVLMIALLTGLLVAALVKQER